jgi:3-deoxy-7-phosphoheptulonate synthase
MMETMKKLETNGSRLVVDDAPHDSHAERRVALAVIAPEATEDAVRALVELARSRRFRASVYDVGPGVVLVHDVTARELAALIGDNEAIERTIIPDTRYRLARREVRPAGSVVSIGGVPFGGESVVLVAGPCAVESGPQVVDAARAAAAAGASVLRGGAFKPRTSPYNFQGLGMHGIQLLAEARAVTGLPFVTEVMDASMIETMYPFVDAFQVGARNMQNFDLLRALGEVDKPVLLKRGPAATLEEWLLAAEYILLGGNEQVILCERGIRTFCDRTRFTLDLATVALAKRETHLPVIVDPSHATGDPALIAPMALAALAAGADGVMVETHPQPEEALSDGHQALRPAELAELGRSLRVIAAALGRTVAAAPPRTSPVPRVRKTYRV